MSEDGGHGPDCGWCPVCQLAAALRADHPELIERVAEAASAVSTAVRALLEAGLAHAASVDGAGARAEQDRAHDGGSDPRAPRPTPRPRVERVDLDAADDAS